MNGALDTVDETAADTETGLYLTFILDGEEYGIDILRVQEIRGWVPVTRVPNSPDYLKGVLNLRGNIIPVVDLRLKLGFSEKEYSETTVVIVVWVHSEDKQRCMGVVVDAVADTYSLALEDVRSAPMMGGGIDPEYIAGLTTVNEQMVVMLDVDTLMNSDELACDTAKETQN